MPALHVLSNKPRSPAFSLGGRFKYADEMSSLKTPGPAAYTPREDGKKRPPQYSMIPRRDIKHESTGPGPAAYTHDGKLRNTEGVVLKSRTHLAEAGSDSPGPAAYNPVNPNHVSPCWSLTRRPEDASLKAAATTPGPSSYDVKVPRKSLAFTIYGRIRAADAATRDNPGPGAYTVPDTGVYLARPPAFSLGPRIEYNPDSLQTPGPAAYDPKVLRHQGFTLTPRRDLAALFTAHNTPGPGAYSPFERPITAPSMGIGARFPGPSRLHPTPGPAEYGTPRIDFYSVKPFRPAFSMIPRRALHKSSDFTPGPAAYSPNVNSVMAVSPRWSLFPRIADHVAKEKSTYPGPSHYNVLRPNSSPAFTMKPRIYPKPAVVTPSPAHYNPGPLTNTIKARPPAFSLGPRIEYNPDSLQTPGPAAYDPAYSF